MINIIIAIAGTLYSAYTDIKTGEVPEWLTNSMIILGIAWTAFTYSFDKLIFVWLTAAIVFAIGWLLYIFGEMGGGDTKLFTGIALLIPFYQHDIYPFILPVCMLAGIILMIGMPIGYFRKIVCNRKKINDFNSKIIKLAIYEIILAGFGIFWFIKFGLFGLLILPLMISTLIIPFKDDISKLFFAKKKDVQKLDEEDVISLELIDEKIRKKLGLWRKTLTAFELKKLKECAKNNNIKTVLVLENLPKFVPYIFVSLILNLIFGDFIMLIFKTLI